MEVKEVPIEAAVGLPLAYDVTEIVPGERKGAVLRRGHLITEADLDTLRRVGKSYLRVLKLEGDEIHEDEAAAALARLLAGSGIEVVLPGEAWADLRAFWPGLLKVDRERLLEVNLVDGLLAATLPSNVPVKQGQTIARVKVRDLCVRRVQLDRAGALAAGEPVVSVKPFRPVRAGAVITGREVFEGRVEDAFAPLIRRRLESYGSALGIAKIVPDTVEDIASAVRETVEAGVGMVLVTGGMSPDDCTVAGMLESGVKLVFHGVPVSPGAMTALGYIGEIPVIGVPGGLLARPRGFLDLLLPRLLAGERLSKEETASYGYGGLCWSCKNCVFPACAFAAAGG